MNIQQIGPLWLTRTEILSDTFMIKSSSYVSIFNFLDCSVPCTLRWIILFNFLMIWWSWPIKTRVPHDGFFSAYLMPSSIFSFPLKKGHWRFLCGLQTSVFKLLWTMMLFTLRIWSVTYIMIHMWICIISRLFFWITAFLNQITCSILLMS